MPIVILQENLHPGVFERPFFDEVLNWEQKKAVQSICQQNYGTLPYLISGPPGTGKTKTLIEIALQLIENVDKVTHILLLRHPTRRRTRWWNRLKPHLPPREMLRLNKPTLDVRGSAWRGPPLLLFGAEHVPPAPFQRPHVLPNRSHYLP